MTVLAITSHKGGTGKTTLSLNLALAFANRGWSTLLVDGDPQGGIGLSLLGHQESKPGLVECLLEDVPFHEAVLSTRIPQLSILKNGRDSPERGFHWEQAFSANGSASGLLDSLRDAHEVVLIDTPAGIYGATWRLVSHADSLVVTMQAEPLSLRCLNQVIDTSLKFRKEGLSTQLIGIVLTMVDTHNTVSQAVVQEVWRSLPTDLQISAFIPRKEVFLEASAKGVPVGLLSRRPPSVDLVFHQIAAELEPRMDLHREEVGEEPLSIWT